MENMWVLLGYFLLAIGVTGFCYQCIIFVRKTLPQNYGSNPGFGCLEKMVQPWFMAGCVGAGLALQSFFIAITVFAVGFFSIGFLAQLLAHVFGKK